MGISKVAMKAVLLELYKVCENTSSRHTQATELKYWGLYPVHVYTSRLCLVGIMRSQEVTLQIGFFSGPLSGLGHSLRVRWCALAKSVSPL